MSAARDIRHMPEQQTPQSRKSDEKSRPHNTAGRAQDGKAKARPEDAAKARARARAEEKARLEAQQKAQAKQAKDRANAVKRAKAAERAKIRAKWRRQFLAKFFYSVGFTIRLSVVLAVCAGVAAVIFFGKEWVVTNRSLMLSEVRIQKDDGTPISPARLREFEMYADVSLDQPFWEVDLDEVNQRIRMHPYVQAATVKRVPPRLLQIEITERHPVALVTMAGGQGDLYLVDDVGNLFKRLSPDDNADLPSITGLSETDFSQENPKGAGLLADGLMLANRYAASERVFGVLSEVHYAESGDWILVFDDGFQVLLGKALPAKIDRLSQVKRALQSVQVQAISVDIRDDKNPNRLVARMTPAQTAAVDQAVALRRAAKKQTAASTH